MSGLFPNDRPDLVISGINGGDNTGTDWIGSGTIGAVRMAAFLGVRGISFSGFDDDNKESFELIPKWIAKFLKTGIVEKIDRHSYLTVAFPVIPLDKIKGIKFCKRRIRYEQPEVIQFKKIYGDSLTKPDNKTIWAIAPTGNPDTGNEKDDVYYLQQGNIVITAMTINENNENLSKELNTMESLIPKFNNN